MLNGVLGGGLIGLAATLFWVANGRVAGISGVIRGAIFDGGRRAELVAFLGGLVAAGLLARATGAASPPPAQPLGGLAAAGLLVGIGTRVGGGCTSGHGVCGISRLSLRSLVATATFVTVGAATVLLAGHLAPRLMAP